MIFKPSQKERAIKYIDRIFERQKFIKIEPVTETKTLSQNAYIWLVFTHVAVETGGDKDDIYYYYLKKFPKFKEISFMGEIDLIPISLSKFTKEQMSKFIDEVVIDARREGFDVPDSEDLKALQMMNYYKSIGYL